VAALQPHPADIPQEANPRAAGKVTLRRAGRFETYKVEEARAENAIPVLRKYIAEIRVTRSLSSAATASSG
jgi:hypothetical protein